jgi:hypothetical protein
VILNTEVNGSGISGLKLKFKSQILINEPFVDDGSIETLEYSSIWMQLVAQEDFIASQNFYVMH